LFVGLVFFCTIAYNIELSATPTERPYHYRLTDNLNKPPHIAAHLQAAQSQCTDPSLQKSYNLANAPKPTHHPDKNTTKNFGRQKQLVIFGQIMPKQKMSTVEKISFGQYIRELRESANLPLRKVAAELDIDTSTLSKIEKNERNANEQIIDGISRIFHIDKSELKLRYISDKITYQLLEEDNGLEILKVAEEKIKYQRLQNKK
jgi:transcriptional regulator with XRE-family HTH domain